MTRRLPKFLSKIFTKLFANEKQPYLTEIGVDSWPGNHWGGVDFFGSISSAIRAKRKKRKYGVDPRNAWELDDAFYRWLYVNLCQLLKDTNADLSYRTFEHNGQTYTEEEYIRYLQRLCVEMMTFDEFAGCPDLEYHTEKVEGGCTLVCDSSEEDQELLLKKHRENFEKNEDLRKELCDVFCELLPYLWW